MNETRTLPNYRCEVCGHFNAEDNSSWCAHMPPIKVLKDAGFKDIDDYLHPKEPK